MRCKMDTMAGIGMRGARYGTSIYLIGFFIGVPQSFNLAVSDATRLGHFTQRDKVLNRWSVLMNTVGD